MAKAGAFEKIYASSFMFDNRGVAQWPAQAINYTNKTQFLFRIEKGTLDVNDSSVNEYFPPEDIRVPFRNMVYIGDSDTDIPCMKLVNAYGGHSIGVFNNDTLDKTKVYKMLHDNRIKYFAPADYTEGSKLDGLVKSIIIRTTSNEVLEERHFACKKEQEDAWLSVSDAERAKKRMSLIASLDASKSFETTHTLMNELIGFDDWTETEIDILLDIALTRHPVRYLLNDYDVKNFYASIIDKLKQPSEKALQVKSKFVQE